MKKRTILTSLAVLIGASVTALLASPDADAKTCNDKAVDFCTTSKDDACYFYLKGDGEPMRSSDDRCWFNDHKFVNVAQ